MPAGPLLHGSPTFMIDPHHLHIWPRHSFMLIALPNKVYSRSNLFLAILTCTSQDASFTCTLFAPTEDMAQLTSPEVILPWFRAHFPDALDLIGASTLLEDFRRNPRSSLISIKACPPIM